MGGLGEGGLHGSDEVGLVVVNMRFSLRGVRGGGRRGGHRGGRAEGLQAGVGGRVGAGQGGRGGRRCDGAAVAAGAAGFGTAFGQSSHSSQHPHWANKALLMGGQQRGSCGRRPLLRRRWGGVWMHLATHAHY